MFKIKLMFPAVGAILIAMTLAVAPVLAGPAGGIPCQLGIYADTDTFLLDQNGNGLFDGAATDARFKLAQAAGVGDPVVGNWNGDTQDDVAKFVPATGKFFLDSNGNHVWNAGVDRGKAFVGSIAGGQGFAGDWAMLGNDQVGRYVPDGRFFLDFNDNGTFEGASDKRFPFAPAAGNGIPVAGDFGNNGWTSVGKYVQSSSKFFLDTNGSFDWNAGVDSGKVFAAAAAGGTALPLVGNWDGAGGDEIGIYVPSTGAVLLDYNGNGVFDGPVTDRRYNLAQAVTPALYVACDLDGTTGDETAKYQQSTSKFFADMNANFDWNGSGGGDRISTFAAAAAGGTAIPIAGAFAPPAP